MILQTDRQTDRQTGYPSIDRPWLRYYEKLPEHNDDFDGSIFELIWKNNQSRLDTDALIYFGQHMTFRNLFQTVNQVANTFVSMNIHEKDVVSICMPTTPETIYLILACNQIGAVANLIDPRVNEARIVQFINGVKSKCVFFITNYEEKFMACKEQFCTKQIIGVSAAESVGTLKKFLYQMKTGSKRTSFISWKEFLNKSENNVITPYKFSKNQVAAIVYTSGTTGVAKGVKLSNESINYVAVHAFDMCYDAKPGDSFLNIMPAFLAYGLVCGIVTMLQRGIKNIVIPNFKQENFVDLIIEHKPNITLGVPNFYNAIVQSGKMKHFDSHFSKYSITGGDKMAINLEKEINQKYVELNIQYPVSKGYGMTELSSGIIITIPNICNKLGSCGIPFRDVNIKTVNPETGELLTYNQIGELYISGPSVMQGYVDNEEEEKKIFQVDENGTRWIKTGDLARIDEDGCVFIEGRRKRMIIRPDGHNVFPAAIEEVICKHKAVSMCAVVGKKKQEFANGEIPIAYVVLKKGFPEDNIMEELVQLSAKELPPRDVALEYNFINTIPITENGKIDYIGLKNRAN